MAKVVLNLEGKQAAIFDMDGTMIASMTHHKLAWQEFFKRHNIELSQDEFSPKSFR